MGVPNTGALSKPRFLLLAKPPTAAYHPAGPPLTRKVIEGERQMDCLKLTALPPGRVRPPVQCWGGGSHHSPQSGLHGCAWLDLEAGREGRGSSVGREGCPLWAPS